MVLAFLYLRTKQPRVYVPRAFLDVLDDEQKTPRPAFGMFNWIPAFWSLRDDFILHHQSLDTYLFVRFFRMLMFVCFIGTVITWTILIPINKNGKAGLKGLDSLTIRNIVDPDKHWWHAAVSSVFLGFILFIITRETIFYINLRQAYFTAPRYASRVSPRVVLFTSVPEEYLDGLWIKGDFRQVTRVWLTSDCKKLQKLVHSRDDIAMALEKAEIKLSSIATKKHLKGEKHHSDDPERSGSATTRWISKKERPATRLIPLVGRKVDAVEYYRNQLATLIPLVEREQKKHWTRNAKLIPAVFVEFETQRAAQAAYAVPFWEQPGNMEPTSIGISSAADVLWSNLRIKRAEKFVRVLIANTIIFLLIVFWSIPVGFVGTLANLDNLANTAPFLNWVTKLPSPVMGLLSGFLPTLLVSLLLSLVPAICRLLAILAGCVTQSQVELMTQSWYFAFQVIQVFLVTTFSSGVSDVAKQIWDDATRAPELLANNLPKASNFYLSYFVLQGLASTASTIFQLVPLLLFTIASPYLDSSPREKFNRYISLSKISWGDQYPKFTNLMIIAISYSCIAPLVLGFATIGLSFLYLAFRYNIFYVLSMSVDTRGYAYAKAIQHLSVGVYLAELCLIGLFAAAGAPGPAKFMLAFFIVTLIYQLYLNIVLSPLTATLSDELMAEDEEEALSMTNGTRPDVQRNGVQPRRCYRQPSRTFLGTVSSYYGNGGLFAPFLFHGSVSDYPMLRAKLWTSFASQPPDLPSEDIIKESYVHPAIIAKKPKLWIVKDDLGVSEEEVRLSEKVVDITDEGAWFDEDGHIVWAKDNIKVIPIWEKNEEI